MTEVAILSDLDGTLIDSKASVTRAFRWWAELHGLPEDLVDHIPHGRTSTAAAAVLAPHLDAAVEGERLDDRQRDDTDGVIPIAGAYELLTTRDRIAIVTSCPLRLAHARLAAAGLPVPTVLVTPELTQYGKPHPDPYLLGARLLEAQPHECVVIEDAPAGIASGRAAGMIVVAVLTTHSQAELLGADEYLTDLAQLDGALEMLGIRSAP